MQVFEEMRTKGHEQVVFCSDKSSGLRAIIAIHNTKLGPSLGGCRMLPYKTEEEALEDVLRLSRGMTYKSAAAGLNLGGGKAVLIGDSKTMKSEAMFRAFGRFVESLGGKYITAEDVGTSVQDMAWVHMETAHVTGLSPELGGAGDPSPVTALGVYEGIKASLKWSRQADSLASTTVLVQGAGHVGSHLIAMLLQAGANVKVCDVDADRIKHLKERFPKITVVPNQRVYDEPCDVFAPCALGGVMNPENIARLKCQIVAGSANNVLADEDRDAHHLQEMGILYAPDYVISSGGLINVANEINGYDKEKALKQTRGIYEILTQIFDIAGKEKITTQEAANILAERRLNPKTDVQSAYLNTPLQKRGRGLYGFI